MLLKKGMTDNIENMFKSGSAFSSDLSKYASNVTQDGFSSSDTYQKSRSEKWTNIASLLVIPKQMHSTKTGGQASQLAMSNSLNIDGNMISDTMRTPATEDSVRAWASASGLNADAIAGQWKSTRDMMNRSNTLGSDKKMVMMPLQRYYLTERKLKTQMESGETVAKKIWLILNRHLRCSKKCSQHDGSQ
uniref:Uncharacterized protein n=1 Tax=Klebsiella pneumoniae TaxID=573 RepID=A0A8B0SUQ9_KLEPN|nr:hypothetical protein [Klebsiella pneumoniae]